MAYKVELDIPAWAKKESEKQFKDKSIQSILKASLRHCLDNNIDIFEELYNNKNMNNNNRKGIE